MKEGYQLFLKLMSAGGNATALVTISVAQRKVNRFAVAIMPFFFMSIRHEGHMFCLVDQRVFHRYFLFEPCTAANTRAKQSCKL